MTTKDITDEQVRQAAQEYRAERSKPFVDERLARMTGQPLKVCQRAIERASRRGFVEWGVSARTCWPSDRIEHGSTFYNSANATLDDAEEFLAAMAAEGCTGIDLGALARGEYEAVKFGER